MKEDGRASQNHETEQQDYEGEENSIAELAKQPPFEERETADAISREELSRIAQSSRNLAAGLESDYYRYVRSQARKHDMPYEDLLATVRQENKDFRFGGDLRSKTKFYHSTSMESLGAILASGQLLSRSERAKRGEDLSNIPGSSSEKVQFTHDSFNQEGELTESGFGSTVGAIGSEVSFVFGGDLIDEDSFDAAAYYPNVDKVDIAQKCLAIVVKKPEQLEQVKKMVEAQQINVPVYLASEYDPKSSPKDLDIRKKRALVEHANTRNQAEIQAQTEQLENPEVEEAEVEEPEVVEGEEAAGFPAESAEQPLTAEFLTESELGAVARAVDGTDMDARALMAICQGSRSAFEKSGIIYTSLKDMLEKTLTRNAESRTAQNYGEEQTR